MKEMSWCIVTCSVLIDREEGYQMCELTIVGLAFLWHQIRCIVALLFMIGQRKEKPEVGGEHYCSELHIYLQILDILMGINFQKIVEFNNRCIAWHMKEYSPSCYTRRTFTVNTESKFKNIQVWYFAHV